MQPIYPQAVAFLAAGLPGSLLSQCEPFVPLCQLSASADLAGRRFARSRDDRRQAARRSFAEPPQDALLRLIRGPHDLSDLRRKGSTWADAGRSRAKSRRVTRAKRPLFGSPARIVGSELLDVRLVHREGHRIHHRIAAQSTVVQRQSLQQVGLRLSGQDWKARIGALPLGTMAAVALLRPLLGRCLLDLREGILARDGTRRRAALPGLGRGGDGGLQARAVGCDLCHILGVEHGNDLPHGVQPMPFRSSGSVILVYDLLQDELVQG